MQEFRISTVSTNVTLNDLGGRTFSHPTSNFNMLTEFSYDELAFSINLRDAISDGYLTVKNELGNDISRNPFGLRLTIKDNDSYVRSNVDILDMGSYVEATQDSTTEIKITTPHEIDEHTDVDPKPSTQSYLPKLIDGHVYWVTPYNTGIIISRANCEFLTGSQYLPYVEITNSSWTSIRMFRYEGTNNWTPTIWRLITGLSNSGTGYARIVNNANGLVICSLTWTNTIPTIITTSSISNLPASTTIFDLQMRSPSNPKSRIYWFELASI